MKLFSSVIIIVTCCLSLFDTDNNSDKAYFEVSIQFCNETYKDFFGDEQTTNIIRLVDEKGKKHLLENEKNKPSRFFIDKLPFGKYKINYKNIKGKRTSIPIEVNQSSQTYELCIDKGVNWKEPSIFNEIADGEFLEILFEGAGGVYYYEKVVIGRQDDDFFIKSIPIKRDYSVKDETKSYYENLIFKELPTNNAFISLSDDDVVWLNHVETLMYFLETKSTCSSSEERYYFIKNGELLAEFKNGFCFKISPWGKLAKRFLNR